VDFDRASVASAETVKRATEAGSAQILDARAAARFSGMEAEPRPGLRSGHIPAVSVCLGARWSNQARLNANDEVKTPHGAGWGGC